MSEILFTPPTNQNINIDIHDTEAIIQLLEWMTKNMEKLGTLLKNVDTGTIIGFGQTQNDKFILHKSEEKARENIYYRDRLESIFHFFYTIAQNEKIQPYIQKYIQAMDIKHELDEEVAILGIIESYALALRNKKYLKTYADYIRPLTEETSDMHTDQVEMLYEKHGNISEMFKVLAVRYVNHGQYGGNQLAFEFGKKLEYRYSKKNHKEIFNYILIEKKRHPYRHPNQVFDARNFIAVLNMYKFDMNLDLCWKYAFAEIINQAEEGKENDLEGLYYAVDIEKKRKTPFPQKVGSLYSSTYLDLIEKYLTQNNYFKAEALLKVLDLNNLDLIQKTVKLYLHAIVNKLIDKDTEEIEIGLKKYLKEEFVFGDAWQFNGTDAWLEKENFTEEKRTYLKKLTQLIKENKG